LINELIVNNQYKHKFDVKKYDPSLGDYITKMDWWDEIIYYSTPYKTQTREEIQKIVLERKYQSLDDVDFYDGELYDYMIQEHFHDIDYFHVDKKTIYVLEFPDNVCYIGESFDIDKISYQHKTRGKVYKYMIIKKINKLPEIKILDYIFDKNGCIKKYKRQGWKVL
jgi:predicted GIY-YIG superfamily endonuclease